MAEIAFGYPFIPGALVHARGREWVVLPESTAELLMLRPVGGLDEEVTGVLPAVEPVESATFRLPGHEDLGDFASGRLLRDAAEGEYVAEVGRRTVLDQGDDDDAVALDFSPGAKTEGSPEPTRRRLLEFARRAEALDTADDRKLQGAAREIGALLADGFHPVVFCRFVDTAEYVARHLRATLAKDVRVEPVTGRLPPAEREARIARLTAEGGRFVLVCTDCLSEGINLQAHFDAVLHYDLAWNPTATSSARAGWTGSGRSGPRCGSSPGTARTTPSTASSSMS